jgi:hypothetical protein
MTDTYIESLAVDPTNGQTVYAGTLSGSGVFKTTDGGASWSAASNGITSKNIWSLAIDPSNHATVYAGTDSGGVFKTSDGGLLWSASSSGITGKTVRSLAIDTSNSLILYAGTNGGVYKTTDGGALWSATGSEITASIVYSLSIDPANNQTIYAATSIGVFKTTNGGTSWSAVSSGYIWSLTVDPSNSQTIYASAYKSIDNGATWRINNVGIVNTNIWSLDVDPNNNQTVYAATGLGVYKSLSSSSFPLLTNLTTVTFAEMASSSFQIASSGWPAPVFSLSGILPTGLIFDITTGTISGTPATGTAGTYPLIITATNGIPPDTVRDITLTVLPASTLAATIITPSKGAGLPSLTTITGTASGSGLVKVEIQISDGSYYLKNDDSFALIPTWLTAAGTTTWSLDTSSVPWREGISYTITARAFDGSATSLPVTSSFTIQIPISKAATILSLSFTSGTLRAGNSTSMTGLLVKSDNTAISGQTVTLLITPPSNAVTPGPAFAVIPVTTDMNGVFTTGVLSQFATPGVYMINARFEGTSELAASFASQALGVTPQSGYAIIISGKTTDNSLLEQHTASVDAIYSTLVNKRGFLPDNITYLKSTTSAPITRQQIQDAITIWARDKLAAAPGPLYLIMIDHGSTTGFILENETLTPDQLKGYLDTLESDHAVVASGALTAHNRIIMIGSCYSGTFASKLSKTGRVIITSANTDEQSIAGFTIYNSGSKTTYYGGEYFIDSMFSYLGRGDSFKEAFLESLGMVGLRDPRETTPGIHAGVHDTLAQHPLLDDNGDGKPSYFLDTDGAVAANLYLGVGIRSLGNPADIIAVTDTTTIPATQTTETTLKLKVNDNSRIAKAWMEIRTPVVEPPTNGGTGQIIPALATLPLYYDGLHWNGSYNFPKEGTYTILYYTQDNQTGDIAPAKSSVVYKQKTDTSTAPAIFSLISPHDGDAVNGMFPLTWQEVTSANKITYTLQVAKDANFTDIIYKAENILYPTTHVWKDSLKDPKTNTYYCTNAQSFCYWKVQATDSFGTIQYETQPWTFTISDTSAVPYFLSGQVISTTTGLPLHKVSIAVNKNGSTVSNTTNTEYGSYVINLGSPGDYTITLGESYSGYQKRSASISVTTQGTTTRNFALSASSDTDPVNGQCGSSDGQAQGAAPATGLCTTGIGSTVTGTGPWSWTCNGTYGGSTANCTSTIDITAPTLALSTLADGAITNNNTMNISGTLSDSSGVAGLTVNNTQVTITNETFSVAVTLQTGSNTITTIATDNAGNQKTDTRTITLDQSAPTLTVSAPADNSKTTKATANISGTINETSTVTVTVNSGTQNATITGSNYSATVNLTSGLNTVTITATDLAGNTSSAVRTLTYDNSNPSLAITEPNQDITTTQSALTISGTVSDTITNTTVTISFNNQTYTPVINNGTFAQQFTMPAAGTYTITATATDEAGNSSSVTRNVIYTPPVNGQCGIVLAQRE